MLRRRQVLSAQQVAVRVQTHAQTLAAARHGATSWRSVGPTPDGPSRRSRSTRKPTQSYCKSATGKYYSTGRPASFPQTRPLGHEASAHITSRMPILCNLPVEESVEGVPLFGHVQVEPLKPAAHTTGSRRRLHAESRRTLDEADCQERDRSVPHLIMDRGVLAWQTVFDHGSPRQTLSGVSGDSQERGCRTSASLAQEPQCERTARTISQIADGRVPGPNYLLRRGVAEQRCPRVPRTLTTPSSSPPDNPMLCKSSTISSPLQHRYL